ncbi:hypothetical protein [Flavobacterium beibuense]|uniref:hypothetical protein n=1 Tax=Flavobacterium beibuense TaxID=657326 RepID=UPI000AC2BFF4|nr:hypothetical protein [Flavobacterium beibuense]
MNQPDKSHNSYLNNEVALNASKEQIHAGNEPRHRRIKEKFSPGLQHEYNPEDFCTD